MKASLRGADVEPGNPDRTGRAHDRGNAVTVEELNRLPGVGVAQALERCCGAHAWVEAMCAARPFAGRAGLFLASEAATARLEREDWLEAFSHHPKIGDVDALRRRFAATAAWAGEEQRGAAAASESTLAA